MIIRTKKDYAIISEDQTVWYGRSTQSEAEVKAKEIANERSQIVMLALVIEEIRPDNLWSDNTINLEAEAVRDA